MSERRQEPKDRSNEAVDAAWRAHSREEPSPAVDEGIRAAARRAIASDPVTARPSARAMTRNWRPLAAVAAVAVLAFGLLRWMPHDELKPTGPRDAAGRAEEPAAAPAGTPAPRPEATAQLDSGAHVPERAPTRSEAAPVSNATRELPAETIGPQPRVEAPPAGDQARETGADNRFGMAAAAPAVQAPTSSPAAEAPPAPAQREPASFIDEIETLHAAGLDERAAELLRRFRTSYPDADELLPEKLRPWAASIKD